MARPQTPADASSLTKWEDAFQHSIPTVRALEKQLRVNLAENRQRLQSLVGESYRDLLRTAERIIEMDDSIQEVESHLAVTSSYCNWSAMQNKAKSLNKFQKDLALRDQGKYVFAAQLAVLQGCPSVISRLLQRDSSCLLAAKIYVIARMLLKSLSQKGVFPIVENLRKQIAGLRKFLLRRIDRQIGAGGTTSELLENMSAYSLVTSSSCSEIFMHFQSQRVDAISNMVESEETPESIRNALGIYNRLLVDTKEIFPKRLSTTLANLKSRTLLDESGLRKQSELNLSVYERWIPEDIRQYTPWVRHDDLLSSKVDSETTTKSNKAVEILMSSLKKILANVHDVQGVVVLRKETLSLWRQNRQKLAAIGSDIWEATRDEFRDIFKERLRQVLKTQALSLSADAILKMSENVQKSRAECTDVWDSVQDLSKSGRKFKEAILSLAYGEGQSLKKVKSFYNEWLRDAVSGYSAIQDIAKETEWNPDDDEEEEDREFDKEDSKGLAKAHREFFLEAYKSFEAAIAKAVEYLQGDDQIDRESFFLRVLNSVKYQPPRHDSIIVELDWFGEGVKRQLHKLIANGTIKAPVRSYEKKLAKKDWSKNVSFSSLWEGSPPLPVHPSPSVFKLLYSVAESMSLAGVDIWTPAAVEVLKEALSKRIWSVLKPALEGSEASNEQSLQTMFDVCYLDSLGGGLLAKDYEEVYRADNVQQTKIAASAEEYWKKTRLLFGLLSIA